MRRVGVTDERLAELGLELPDLFAGPPRMALKFDLVRVVGDVAYVSGHGPGLAFVREGGHDLVGGKL